VSVAIEEGNSGDADESPSEDELFDVLASRRRRYAVHALEDVETQTDLGTLAEQVAMWEYDVDVGELSSTERKRVYTALQQSHLPKMDDAGLVDFDKEQGVIEPTPELNDVDIYLEVVSAKEIPWSKYYLGLAGLAVAILLALWTDVSPFTVLPDLTWMTFVVVAFTVSAVVHSYYATNRRLGNEEKPPEAREHS
jgi:hypothetical protein